MSEKLHKLFGPDGHIPEEMFLRYVGKQLSAVEEHKVERHTLECELCSDVMEGLLAVRNREKIPVIIDSIKKEIHLKTSPRVKVVRMTTRTWISMAAGLALVLSMSWYFLQQQQELKEPVTSEELKKTEQTEPVGPVDETGKGLGAPSPKPLEESKTEIRRNSSGEVLQEQQKYEDVPAGDGINQDVPVSVKDADGPGDEVFSAPKTEDKKALLSKEKQLDDLENITSETITQEGDLKEIEVQTKSDKSNKDQKDEHSGGKYSGLKKKKSRSVAFDGKNAAPEKSEKKPETTVTTNPPPSPNMVITTPQEDNNLVVTGNNTNSQSNSGYTQTISDSVTITSTTVSSDALTSRYQKGKQFLSEGKWDAAITEFNEVIKDPKHASYEDARWDLTTAYLKKGDKTAAKKLLEEISKGTGKNKLKAEEELKKL